MMRFCSVTFRSRLVAESAESTKMQTSGPINYYVICMLILHIVDVVVYAVVAFLFLLLFMLSVHSC